jgi:hypothetical protein
MVCISSRRRFLNRFYGQGLRFESLYLFKEANSQRHTLKTLQLDKQLEAMQDEAAMETHAPTEDDDDAGQEELQMMREADYVVRPGAWYLHRRMGNAKDLIWKLIPGADPSRKNLTAVLSSLPPARPQSIFLARGPHNASDADGDLEVSQELHFTGSPRGSTWIGWAEKIDIRGDLPHPERGYGRIRIWPGGTGTTFRNIRWESENLHCVVAEGSAVMFEGCELRCEVGDPLSQATQHSTDRQCSVPQSFPRHLTCTNSHALNLEGVALLLGDLGV